MFSASRATLLAAGSLALAIQGGAARNPCGDVNGVMKTIVGMAPECFEECPDMCKPLGNVVTKYLAKDDTWGTVCKAEKAFNCPLKADSCKTLMATAKSMKLPVPQSVGEMEKQCSSEKSSSKTKQAKGSDGPSVESAAGATAAMDASNTTSMAMSSTTTAADSSTTAADDNTTMAPDESTTAASTAAGSEAPGVIAALFILAASAA